ncbi:putative ubiquitin carboxyl-terminal hydrolase 50 [Boleophthalmus pectinirostris]|uniref:putative ubiquitin carboxyl-terminal hydrolase 50 n=1 Tax=Boleophthalmus pectinirostris TaxID=150288 RepID=UPI00242E2EA5|nr:putative ubiquitin carboxyl-terminal hydrolase 50 [Boleophthalmus pectinirostris]
MLVHEQRCAAEYLELLLNHLSEEVSEPFRGELWDTTRCSKGHWISNEISRFWTLPLAMEHIQGGSVLKGLKGVFKEKTFSGIYCEKCKKKTEATIIYTMEKPPLILVLLLKRFDIGIRSYHKSNCEVDIPAVLHTKDLSYSLCGVVDHSGGLHGGHYTATVKSKDRRWYYISDTYVKETWSPQNAAVCLKSRGKSTALWSPVLMSCVSETFFPSHMCSPQVVLGTTERVVLKAGVGLQGVQVLQDEGKSQFYDILYRPVGSCVGEAAKKTAGGCRSTVYTVVDVTIMDPAPPECSDQ